MSSDRPFRTRTVPAVAALAAVAWLTPVMVTAQTAQQAALGAGAHAETSKETSKENPKSEAGKTEAAKSTETATTGAATTAVPAQKSIAERAADRVKQAAKSASDIFARVPCLPPKGGYKKMGSLPHAQSARHLRQPLRRCRPMSRRWCSRYSRDCG